MSVTTPVDTDVIIVGGGIAGCSLAALLSHGETRCVVLEERAKGTGLRKNDPRTLAITRASENILRTAGAWKFLPEERIGLFRRMFVWEEEGKGNIEFDSADICESTLGYIIEQNVLEWALLQAIKTQDQVTLYQPATIETLQVCRDKVSITLSDDRELSAKVIIGADGAKSALRRQAGIAYPIHDYHQQAVACIVETEKAHDCVARQRFLSTGPLAFLPMADIHQCGIVWSTTPEHARTLMEMKETVFNRTLAESFSYTLGNVISSKPRAAFSLQHAQAEHYCLPRIALVGDAAHTVHPLAGQGANLGLLDVATLAEVLLDAVNNDRDIGAYPVLRRYERWRRGENFLMLKVLEGMKLLFESKLVTIRHLRNIGLDLTDIISPAKHAIMRQAMGLSGDLPRFAHNLYNV